MYNFSIIIPHYNTPELLKRCLDSIPERADVQIIVVDDCSPDAGTYRERFPWLYSRPHLEFYTTAQGGSAGRARNVGLEHATGRWLLFADADDLFVADFDQILDEYVNAAEDVIYFRKRSVYSDDLDRPSDRSNWNEILYDKYHETGDKQLFRTCFPTCWGAIFRHEMVTANDIRFDELRISNDVYFSAQCGCQARDIRVAERVLYIVTFRKESLSMKQQKGRREVRQEELEIRLDTCFRSHTLFVKHGLIRKDNFGSMSILFYMSKILYFSPRRYIHYFRRLKEIPLPRRRVFKLLYRDWCLSFMAKTKLVICSLWACLF